MSSQKQKDETKSLKEDDYSILDTITTYGIANTFNLITEGSWKQLQCTAASVVKLLALACVCITVSVRAYASSEMLNDPGVLNIRLLLGSHAAMRASIIILELIRGFVPSQDNTKTTHWSAFCTSSNQIRWKMIFRLFWTLLRPICDLIYLVCETMIFAALLQTISGNVLKVNQEGVDAAAHTVFFVIFLMNNMIGAYLVGRGIKSRNDELSNKCVTATYFLFGIVYLVIFQVCPILLWYSLDTFWDPIADYFDYISIFLPGFDAALILIGAIIAACIRLCMCTRRGKQIGSKLDLPADEEKY